MKKTEDIKTESLTITLSSIPSELLELIWKAVDKLSESKGGKTIEKLNHLNFNFCENNYQDISKLLSSAIATHCALLNSNK